jgi:hypothetical protein
MRFHTLFQPPVPISVTVFTSAFSSAELHHILLAAVGTSTALLVEGDAARARRGRLDMIVEAEGQANEGKVKESTAESLGAVERSSQPCLALVDAQCSF